VLRAAAGEVTGFDFTRGRETKSILHSCNYLAFATKLGLEAKRIRALQSC
jgi:hypothetical protein